MLPVSTEKEIMAGRCRHRGQHGSICCNHDKLVVVVAHVLAHRMHPIHTLSNRLADPAICTVLGLNAKSNFSRSRSDFQDACPAASNLHSSYSASWSKTTWRLGRLDSARCQRSQSPICHSCVSRPPASTAAARAASAPPHATAPTATPTTTTPFATTPSASTLF